MPEQPVLTVSVVLFKNDPSHIVALCDCFLKVDFPISVLFIDNSEEDSLARLIPADPRFKYELNSQNTGYGRGHNKAILNQLDIGKYHLVINADVYFDADVLVRIMAFMDAHTNVGLLLPRVLNPDGTDQNLYKLLPSPFTLTVRRFIPGFMKGIFSGLLEKYELSYARPEDTFEAPYLSGCFMWLRKEVLKEVGGFDERFFLYFEDVDFSRRLGLKSKTVYYGKASIYHYFQRGSYGSFKLMCYHVVSAIRYFNKYGWIDKERLEINQRIQNQFINRSKDSTSPIDLPLLKMSRGK